MKCAVIEQFCTRWILNPEAHDENFGKCAVIVQPKCPKCSEYLHARNPKHPRDSTGKGNL